MKIAGLIIIMLSTLAFSCQPSKKQEKPESIDSVNKDNPVADNKISTRQAAASFDKFEVTFERENEEPKLKQLLGVSWLPNDSIEFLLVTEDGSCNTQYSGKARNIYPEVEPEADRDEFGNIYYILEYEVIEAEPYSLKIRVAVDKARAKIVFKDKSRKETDCVPAPGLVLVNKKAP